MAGGSKSSSTPVDMTPAAFKAMQSPFASQLAKMLGTKSGGGNALLQGIPAYAGQMTAPMGANEQTILDQLMAQVSGSGSGAITPNALGSADSYLQQVLGGNFMPQNGDLGGFADMLSGAGNTQGYSGNEANPFLDAAIKAAQRPTLQGLEETLSRTLPGRFTAGGQFTQPQGSSAFDRAAAIATRGAGDTMGEIATNLSYATMEAERGRQFEAQEGARTREDAALREELQRQFAGTEGERGRQNEAAGLATQVSTQQVNTMVQNLQAQALPRLIQEFGIERGLEQFNNRVNALLSTLGITAGVTQPTIAQEGKSKTKPNVLGPVLGMFG